MEKQFRWSQYPGSPFWMSWYGLLLVLGFVVADGIAAEDQEAGWFKWPIEAHGFFEMRAGYRTQNDRYEKDMSIMESRLQVDLFSATDWADFKAKGDFYGDGVAEQGDFDLREANVFTRPADWMDVKLGRQILT